MSEVTACINFHNVTKSGDKMRPGTAAPEMHWVWMMQQNYPNLKKGIWVVYDDEGVKLKISKDLVDQGETYIIGDKPVTEGELAFEHLMFFIKMHGIDYDIVETECAKCDGHPKCLYAQDMAEKHRKKVNENVKKKVCRSVS